MTFDSSSKGQVEYLMTIHKRIKNDKRKKVLSNDFRFIVLK